MTYYQVDAAGWGTPFLLVPEATNVDDMHLQRLAAATESDVVLSDHSPLGVPFWTLTTSASERARERRIQEGHPGSPCTNAYLAQNTEFTSVPLCPASKAYQMLKLRALDQSRMTDAEMAEARERVLSKACICHDLAGGATIKDGIDPAAVTAVCPGPNIINFKKIVTLQEMIDHIYGRITVTLAQSRPPTHVR